MKFSLRNKELRTITLSSIPRN